MKIAVVTCMAYHDAIPPFLALFRRFWPDCPYEVVVVDDRNNPGQPWCSVVAEFASRQTRPVLLLQEDFWLNAPVNGRLIARGLDLLAEKKAAMVRLYPCPGGVDGIGDAYFAGIPKGTAYRVSCQASIWNPDVLHEIASHFETPAEFEILGTPLSANFDEPFLAFKRDVQPWPISYYCTAISRGKYNPGAIEFCRKHGVEVDTSMRAVSE